MTDEPRPTIDYISDHVTLEWLDNHQIAVFTILVNNRQNVKVWADKTETIIGAWAVDKPYAVLHDVQTAILSSYAQQRATKLLRLLQKRQLRGRYAVLVADNVFGQTIMAFVNFTLRTRPEEGIHGQCFTSREAGLAWLREQF